MPPLYDFKCEDCGTTEEKFAKVENRESVCECGGIMKRLISLNYNVHGDIQPYLDEHIGDKPIWIKSKQHRREMMKKHKVYEAHGKGWL